MTSLFEVSTLDVVIFFLFIYVVYKMFFKKADLIEPPNSKEPIIEPLEKQDLTIKQLKQYNGIDDPHICMAILGKVKLNILKILIKFPSHFNFFCNFNSFL